MTPWTIACQALLSMGFSRQEYWSGLPCLPPGDLPNAGMEPGSPALQADSLLAELPDMDALLYGSRCVSEVELINEHFSNAYSRACFT